MGMNVLNLGIISSPLTPIIAASGCQVIEYSDEIDLLFLKNNAIDFVVSYRYKHVIRKKVIRYLPQKIINLHISLLPWNKGADPNLWSLLEDTPKGVSIHYIDDGIDTGDIIYQKELIFDEENDTLASSYTKLNDEIIELFKIKWSSIKEGKVKRFKQLKGGSFHLSTDKKKFEYLLADNHYDTYIKDLIGKANNGKAGIEKDEF
jgi:methionyl-tRNA formyltransferase